MDERVVYESPTAHVIARGDVSSGTVIVTFFTYATKESSLVGAPGFGSKLFADLGMPALHFVNRQNHWWQVPDLLEVLDAGYREIAGAKRRIGYGASMGGYAALRFSSYLGFDETLCFSPQFSIDGRRVPWEKRWRMQAEKLDFSMESMTVSRCAIHHIAFDPRTRDRRHVEAIVRKNPGAHFDLHPLECGGHFVIGELQSTGILRPIIVSMRTGRVDCSSLSTHPARAVPVV